MHAEYAIYAFCFSYSILNNRRHHLRSSLTASRIHPGRWIMVCAWTTTCERRKEQQALSEKLPLHTHTSQTV